MLEKTEYIQFLKQIIEESVYRSSRNLEKKTLANKSSLVGSSLTGYNLAQI